MDSEATAPDDPGFGRAAQPIGAALGAARVARGLELVDIARDTRVPLRHLAAIEADAHDSLPALPYAIGFVKAFARAVGVDAEMAGARFRAETNKSAHVPVAPAMAPMDERRLPPRGLVTASIAALLAVIALVVAWSTGAFDAPLPPAAAPAAPPAAVVATAPPVVTQSVVTPSGVPPTDAAASPTMRQGTPGDPPTPDAAATSALTASATPTAVTTGSVVITANADVWFKVSVYDPAVAKVVTVKTGVLAKGERYVPPPTPGLRLWTGRAGALAITVDGRPIPPLGGPVETVKNVSLDARDLRARIITPAPLPGRAGPPVG